MVRYSLFMASIIPLAYLGIVVIAAVVPWIPGALAQAHLGFWWLTMPWGAVFAYQRSIGEPYLLDVDQKHLA